VRPLIAALAPDINVVMNDPDTRIELPLDATLFQPYCQILDLVMP
jgi:hypothetical protein